MKNSESNGALHHTESPFQSVSNFVQEEFEATIDAYGEEFLSQDESPFQSIYEMEGQEIDANPEEEMLAELLDELHDEEFDEAIEEMSNEAQELYEQYIDESHGNSQRKSEMAAKMTEDHFAPVLHEFENHFDFMIDQADQFDQKKNYSEQEWEVAINAYAPYSENFAPQFDHLFGWAKKLWKKAKKVVSKAAKWVKKGVSYGLKMVKKLGLGWLLRRLKGVAMKFIRWILKKAMGRLKRYLPKHLRKKVTKLARRLPGMRRELADQELYLSPQQEFDLVVAELLLAPNEQEQEMILTELSAEMEHENENPLNDLDEARAQFIQQISQLEEGENPEPHIEQFATVVLTALKWGIRIIGKGRVKRFLVKILAKLIRKLIGRPYSKVLAKRIVNLGFRLMRMELSPEEEAQLGGSAVASVIEETVRQIAQLPDQVLDNEELLEGQVIEAFENAAAAYLPDVLSEETYRKRPKLRESSKHKVLWANKSIGKKRWKRCRYKKLSKEIETELTPYIADEIKTHGGVSLSRVLRDQFGIQPGTPIPVKVHLYETMPGAKLYQIVRHEKIIRGTGNIARLSKVYLHPLTSVAAGLLLGEPGLGCKSRNCWTASRKWSNPHRYYYLEIPSAQPLLHTQGNSTSPRRHSKMNLKFDFVKQQINVCQFLSETDAQNISNELRSGRMGKAYGELAKLLKEGIETVFSSKGKAALNIVLPGVVPGAGSEKSFNGLPKTIQKELKEKLQYWLNVSLVDYLKKEAGSFNQALHNDADGLTFKIQFSVIPDFEILRSLISKGKASLPATLFNGKPESLVQIKAGYTNG